MSKNEHLGLTRLNAGDLIVKQEELDKILLSWAVSTIKRLDPLEPKSTTAALIKNGTKKLIEAALGNNEESVHSISGEYLATPVELSVVNVELSLDYESLNKLWTIGELPAENAQVYYLLGSISTKWAILSDSESEPAIEDSYVDCTGMFITDHPHPVNNSNVRQYYTKEVADPQKRPY